MGLLGENYSFLGLSRKHAKTLAWIFIGLGILFATPPFIPFPDDLLNIFVAQYISGFSITFLTALLLTYTLLPFILLLIGSYIYPYNTESIFYGLINKIKTNIRLQIYKLRRNPLLLIGVLVLIYLLLKFYAIYLIGNV